MLGFHGIRAWCCSFFLIFFWGDESDGEYFDHGAFPFSLPTAKLKGNQERMSGFNNGGIWWAPGAHQKVEQLEDRQIELHQQWTTAGSALNSTTPKKNKR